MAPRTEVIRVRLATDELKILQEAADARGWNLSQMVRELIRTMPR
jgi:uncharacterized protein (DUF1778 family)